VAAVVTRLSVTPVEVTAWPLPGLKLQAISAVAGMPEQLYVTGTDVAAAEPLPVMKLGLLVLLTAIETEAVPPGETGKVRPLVEAMEKVSVVLVTMRLTVAEPDALPLVPVTVMFCAPEGSAIFGAVVTVKITVDALVPFKLTLPGLKEQSAPAGKPGLQLPTADEVEFVKLTAPVKPAAGVIVMVEVAVCPAEILKVAGLADIVNGTVTLTTAGTDDVEPPWVASPS